MAEEMVFGALVGDECAEVRRVPIPEIGPDDVLINIKSCNICTYDYQQWLGLRPQQPYPMAWGHEDSGVIAAVGGNIKDLKVGDQVIANHYKPCLQCTPCRLGRNMNMCEGEEAQQFLVKDQYGYYGGYGCAEYRRIAAKHIFTFQNNIPPEEAGFTEPLATVVHGIRKMRPSVGEKALVIGAGTMGLLNAQVLRCYGLDVTISELVEKKVSKARSLGFDKVLNPSDSDFASKVRTYAGGKGPDMIVIAVGATSAYEQAFEVAPEESRLLIFAASFPIPSWSIHPNLVHYKRWEIYGTVGAALSDYCEAVKLLDTGAVNVEPLIEARVPLKDIQKAFELASTQGNYRISVMLS